MSDENYCAVWEVRWYGRSKPVSVVMIAESLVVN